jgi:hypothetical protein
VQPSDRVAHILLLPEKQGKSGGKYMKILAIAIALALMPNMASARYVLILKDSYIGIIKAGQTYRTRSQCLRAGSFWEGASRNHAFVCIPTP